MTTFSSLYGNRLPGQLVIQITDRCNARCPQCGMRTSAPFQRFSLPTEAVQRILDAAAAKGFQAVSFTGGEPLLEMEKLVTLIHYAGARGIPYIRTGTNGFMFKNSETAGFTSKISRIADELAATPLRNFWISIDSMIPEEHERMRGFSGIVRGIEKALPVFHRRGLYPSANLGINRNLGGGLTRGIYHRESQNGPDTETRFYRRYRQAFRRYYQFVQNLGFTIVNTCYPMSLGQREISSGLSPVYAATATEDIVRFSRPEKRLLYRALEDTIPEFRSRLRIFTPLCALKALRRQYGDTPSVTYPCRGGIDFFFIDAGSGCIFPCGYRGDENLGKLEQLNIRRICPSRRCDACDWECFRDPSDLMGPALEGIHSPLKMIKKSISAPSDFQRWQRDIRYYHACDYFNGRKPPRPDRLRKF